MIRALILTANFVVIFFLGGAAPFSGSICSGSSSRNDQDWKWTSSDPDLAQNSDVFGEISTLSSSHAQTIDRLIATRNHDESEKIGFATLLGQYDPTSVEDMTTIYDVQLYPNSCFGHSLLESMAQLDPILAWTISMSGDYLDRETEIMAYFHNGSYQSQTREEFQNDPYADQVLGGVAPEQTLDGVKHFLQPITGLNYEEIGGVYLDPDLIPTQAERVERIENSFVEFPEHPVIIYSLNHALLIVSGEYDESGDIKFTIHNPSNGSLTTLNKTELIAAFGTRTEPNFSLEIDGNGGDGATDLDPEDPRFTALFEAKGFPNLGVLLPVISQ